MLLYINGGYNSAENIHVHLSGVTLSSKYSLKKKSKGVISGEQNGQGMTRGNDFGKVTKDAHVEA